MGGIKAVTWTEFMQMMIMMLGMIAALITAVWLLPREISFCEAISMAGAAGKLNPVVFTLDNSYNVWSGLFGGMFLALAYFGTRSVAGTALSHR